MSVLLGHFALEALRLDVVSLSYLKQLAFIVFAASAFEAAVGFLLSFFLGKSKTYLVKVLVADVGGENLGIDPALFFPV